MYLALACFATMQNIARSYGQRVISRLRGQALLPRCLESAFFVPRAAPIRIGVQPDFFRVGIVELVHCGGKRIAGDLLSRSWRL